MHIMHSGSGQGIAETADLPSSTEKEIIWIPFGEGVEIYPIVKINGAQQRPYCPANKRHGQYDECNCLHLIQTVVSFQDKFILS